MTLQLQTSRVLLGQIDFDDLLCKLSPGPVEEAPPTLLESLTRFGMLHPPLLRKKGRDLFQIVSGHTRLTAWRDVLRQSSANCLLLSAEAAEAEALALALEEICIRRPPSAMERAFFFRRLLRYSTKEEAAAFLPRLGLPQSFFVVEQIIQLSQLEEPLAQALHHGVLHEQVGRELLDLGFAERLALFEIIDYLQLSVGNQKKLVAICRELAKREGGTIISLLANAPLQAILDHPEANPPQKAANLMRALAERLSPRLTEAEQQFQKFAAGLNLPPGITLTHTQAFEDDRLTLAIDFANGASLREKLPALLPLLTCGD